MPRPVRWSLDALRILWHLLRDPLSRLYRATKKRLGLIRPITILPYRGFGDHQHLAVLGRVQENRDTGSPKRDDPWWRNLAAMIARFRTAEIPDVAIRARIHDQTLTARTDDEGYFDLTVPTPTALRSDRLWHDVEIELLDRVRRDQPPVRTTAQVLVPSAHSTFGVVSDIDDTVMYSHATDLWKLIKITSLNNARTRAPLAGAAAFYRALAAGGDGARRNPFFYVSSASWNLYDLFRDFLELNGFPIGPVLLRDFGLRRRGVQTSHRHKVDKVARIFAATESLPFLLIGDAGQDDPDLYHEIACTFPGRVRAIYIRAVSWRDRSAHVEDLSRDLRARGIDMLLVPDTGAAATHAAARGFVVPGAVGAIDVGRERDRKRPARV